MTQTTSYIHIHTKDKVSGTPFDCTVTLQQPLQKIRSVELVSAEVPIGFYNIREPYNYLLFWQGKTTIPDGYYSVTDIVTQCNAYIPSAYTFSVSSLTGKLSLASTSTGTLYATPLSMLLGFSSSTVTSTSWTASYPPNLAYDLYLNLHIKNLPTQSVSTVPCTFKIPVSVNNGQVQYYTEQSDFSQKIDVDDNKTVISFLQLRVLDVNGTALDNNGFDYSMTLRVVSDN